MEKELIKKEIDIMNQLHHRKLINLHDAFEDDDEMVLIFELWVYPLILTCFIVMCSIYGPVNFNQSNDMISNRIIIFYI